jgi:hypothetical protein
MKKSPLLSAVINMLLPGSSYLYIGTGWKKAIIEFVVGLIVWALCYALVRSWNAPFLLFVIPIIFFIDGLTIANNYNKTVSQP